MLSETYLGKFCTSGGYIDKKIYINTCIYKEYHYIEFIKTNTHNKTNQ